MSSDGMDLARLLVQRAPLLRSLEDGPVTKGDLVEAHGVSRSTVDRAVRDLETVDTVTRQDGVVELTLVGRLALEAYDDFCEVLDAAEACDSLTLLDTDAPIEIGLLRGAEVVDAGATSPHRPVQSLTDLIEDATHVELYGTVVLPEVVEALVTGVLQGSLSVEAYVDPDALDVVVSDFEGDVRRALDSDDVFLAEAGANLPFSLVVVERSDGTTTVAVIYGSHGADHLLVNDTDEAVSWARERLDTIETNARPLA